MGTKEKLIERFKTIPSDFTFDELERLLAIYGFERFKGLRKENLRDNMTNEELVMNMLAGLTTTNITKEEHPVTMDEHAQAASRGGGSGTGSPRSLRAANRQESIIRAA